MKGRTTMTSNAHPGTLVGVIRRAAGYADSEPLTGRPDGTLHMAMMTGIGGLAIDPLPGGKVRVAIQEFVYVGPHDDLRKSSTAADNAVTKLSEQIDAAAAAVADSSVGVTAPRVVQQITGVEQRLSGRRPAFEEHQPGFVSGGDSPWPSQPPGQYFSPRPSHAGHGTTPGRRSSAMKSANRCWRSISAYASRTA
jgi:hypothetical protein